MREIKDVKIGNFIIGYGQPIFVIAEIGINHNGDLDRAVKLIKAARTAGANAVKFQSFRADRFCDLYLQETKDVEDLTGGTKSSYDLYKALELDDQTHRVLINAANDENIMFFSSVFDEETADFLESLGVPAYKIASSDITHIPLIKHVAKKGKPLVISTGMSTLKEIETALDACYSVGNNQVAILHCVSCYPPADEDLNLDAITTMSNHFPHPIGYSDHSEGNIACLAACSLGAKVIEKHFTLDNNWKGPDHRISSIADDFYSMVLDIRRIEKMLGCGIKMPSLAEIPVRCASRRSIRVKGNIQPGEIITSDKIIVLKPEIGLYPAQIENVIGRRAKTALKNHEPITMDKLD